MTQLRVALEARVTDAPTEIDMFYWMNRTALELIGQGGFDHSFDRLGKDEDGEFRQAIKDLV